MSSFTICNVYKKKRKQRRLQDGKTGKNKNTKRKMIFYRGILIIMYFMGRQMQF